MALQEVVVPPVVPNEQNESHPNETAHRKPARDSRRTSEPLKMRVPARNPSRIFHAVCPYWLMSSEGFSAKEQVQFPSKAPRTIAAILVLFTVGLNRNTAPTTPELCLIPKQLELDVC